ncbi:MAG TPA: hypothetical protein VFJ82_01045 [Longimicrobium sp.]|nr:hypothetical protein [Longimicrobium sp.]
MAGLLAVACTDGSGPTGTREASDPPSSLRTPADSARAAAWRAARGLPRFSASALDAGVSLPIKRGDRVEIRIRSTECAAQGNLIRVSGVFTATISTDACYDVGHGAALGPAQADGYLVFEGMTAEGFAGSFRVQGEYPSYVLLFEDGIDADFNDVVLDVRVVPRNCDPILKDSAVVAGIRQLIADTHWDLPLAQRQEQGGYIIQNAAGTVDFVRWDARSAGPCHIDRDAQKQEQALVQLGWRIIGAVHTHPTNGGDVLNPGNCLNPDATGKLVPSTEPVIHLESGPSVKVDLWPWGGSRDPLYAGFVIQPNLKVFRWEKDGTGKLRRIEFNLNDACPV